MSVFVIDSSLSHRSFRLPVKSSQMHVLLRLDLDQSLALGAEEVALR